jgi:hypothetical protein
MALHTKPTQAVVPLVLLLFLAGTQARVAPGPKPVHLMDLKSEFCPEESQQYNVPLTSVDFISENEVLIYTVCRIDRIALSRRDRFQASDPYHVKAVIVNLATSTVERRFDWPTHGRWSGLCVTHAGDLLLHRDNILELLSSDGRVLGHVEIQKTSPDDSTFVWTSHTDDIIAVSQGPISPTRSAGTNAAILNSRNLRMLHQWRDNADVWSLAASSRVAVRSALSNKLLVMRTLPAGLWKTIRTEATRSIANPVFINDVEFAAPVHDAVLLYDVSDQREETLPCHSPLRVVVSRDATTLGALCVKFADRGPDSGRPKITGAEADLYQLPSRRQVTSIPFLPLPSFGFDVGISPDGSKLAMVDHESVSVFEISGKEAQQKAPSQ